MGRSSRSRRAAWSRRSRRRPGLAVSALGLIPVLFESGARPHSPRDLYRAYLAQCDVFVGLYWQRYGWIGPGMGISGLEDEFDMSGPLPRLLYIKSPAPDREPGLAGLIARIEQEAAGSYRIFRAPAELRRLVRDDIATLVSERFARGPVLADATGGRVDIRRVPEPGVSWPMQVGVVPAAASAFQPRPGLRERVGEARSAAGGVVLTQVLSGGGGVGKSQLAACYAREAVARGTDLVVWADAGQPGGVTDAFARAARAVGAAGGDGDADGAAREFLAWAAATRWRQGREPAVACPGGGRGGRH